MCRHSYSLSHENSEKNVLDCYLAYLAPFQGQTAISVENRQFSLPRVYIAPAGIGYRL